MLRPYQAPLLRAVQSLAPGGGLVQLLGVSFPRDQPPPPPQKRLFINKDFPPERDNLKPGAALTDLLEPTTGGDTL